MIITLLVDWAILTFALWVAARSLKGMTMKGGAVDHLVVAGGYGLLSAVLGTVIVWAAGAFTLGIAWAPIIILVTWTIANAICLKIVDVFSGKLKVRSFGTAFVAAALMAVVAWAANWALSHFGVL
ncbi:MAG: phage holin family protein [Sandaracinaceae bacterium]